MARSSDITNSARKTVLAFIVKNLLEGELELLAASLF
jgi:hypothetical protein